MILRIPFLNKPNDYMFCHTINDVYYDYLQLCDILNKTDINFSVLIRNKYDDEVESIPVGKIIKFYPQTFDAEVEIIDSVYNKNLSYCLKLGLMVDKQIDNYFTKILCLRCIVLGIKE